MYGMEHTFSGNPMKEERQRTNLPYVIIFSLIVIGWIVIAIIVAFSESQAEVRENFKFAISVFEKLYIRLTWSFPICISISALIAIVYIYSLSNPSGKIIVDAAVYLICVWMLIVSLSSAVSLTLIDAVFSFSFIIVFIYAAYLIIAFYCARNVGTPIIFDIIQDSCRAMIHNPAIPLFVCAMSAICALIFSLTIAILIGILELKIETLFDELETGKDEDSQNTRLSFYHFFTIIGMITMIRFIVNLTHTVMAGCIIDWYWKKDQGTLSTQLTLLDSIKRTLSFHLGTLTFGAIPLFSSICFVFQTCRRREDGVVKIYNIFTRCFSQMCTFLYIQDFALTQTAIYGHDYSTAILAAHDLVAHNNHEINIAVTEVSTILTLVGSFFIFVPFLFGEPGSVYSIIIPFFIIMTSAPRALLVNKMIIDSNAEAEQEKQNGGEKIALSEQYPPQYPQLEPQYPQSEPQYSQSEAQYPQSVPQYPQSEPQYSQSVTQYPQSAPQSFL